MCLFSEKNQNKFQDSFLFKTLFDKHNMLRVECTFLDRVPYFSYFTTPF